MDESVHDALVKFSKGEFPNRYLIQSKKQKDKWSIKTSAEFANFFVSKGLESVQGDLDISGVIVATFDVSKESDIEVQRVKQFMGIKQAVINSKISGKKILELMEKFPKAFFALSFKTEGFELKIKAKAPKSAKPSTKGGEDIKIDFCSLKTTREDIAREVLFGVENAKEARILHTLKIEQIDLPKGVENPVEIRGKSIRRGRVIRNIIADGKESVTEAEFEA